MSRPLSSLSSSSLNRRNSSLGAYQATQGSKTTGNRSSVPSQERSKKGGHGGASSNDALRSTGIFGQETQQALSSVKVERSQLQDAEDLLQDCRRRINTQFRSSPEVWFRVCDAFDDFKGHQRTAPETRVLLTDLFQERAPRILKDLLIVLRILCSHQKVHGPQNTHSGPPGAVRSEVTNNQSRNDFRNSQVVQQGLVLSKVPVKRDPSLPSTSRPYPETKMESEPDLMNDFVQKIQDRFPYKPEICQAFEDKVLGPISSGQAAEDFVPLVSHLLRRAPELVIKFKNMTKTLSHLSEHRRRRLVTDQPSVPRSHPPPISSGSSALKAFSIEESSDASLSEDEDEPGLGVQSSQNDHHENVQKLLVLPDIDVPPQLRKETPRQMAESCKLMEHQKVCLTWLVRQEEDKHKKGGLLADTMGVGKTVQALALILARPSKDPLRRTTLIVAPLALLRQWEREIATKVKSAYALKTVIVHGPKAKKMTVTHLLEHDVVLCTYGKLQHEYKIRHERKKTSELRILHPRAKFYRVILDEAHNIRNKNTKSSMAAAEIQSQYRLCMTGTPFMNRAAEIFPLIRFLRIRPYNDWQKFSEDINKPIARWDGNERKEGMIKLQALLRTITLRRTKDSLLDGIPIIRLPARTESPAPAEFDQDQREFYLALEQKHQIKFNKYLAAGAVMKNYAYILVLILRLRQVCDHPFLIKNHGIPEGAKLGADEMIKLAWKLPENVVARIKAQDIFQCALCEDDTNNPVIVHSCGHYVCAECFTASMTLGESEGIGEDEDDEGEAMMECPDEKCDNKITPSNILCHNFFVDAHMASEGESQDDQVDSESEEGDSHVIDDEEDENGNLRDFIVGTEDEGSVADDESGSDNGGSESEVDENSCMNLNATVGSSTNGSSQSTARKVSDVVQSTYLVDDRVPVGEDSKDIAQDLPGKSVGTYSSSDDESMIQWKKDQIKRSVQASKALADEEAGNIPELQARPPKRRRSACKEMGTSSKKPRGDAQGGCVGLDKAHTSGRYRRGDRAAMRDNDELNENRSRNKRDKKKKKEGKGRPKGKDFLSLGQMKRDAQSSAAAMSRYKQRLRKEWVSSCKIDKTMEILEGIRKRDPEEKTLVFSLWPSFLDLLEIPMETANFNFTRYDGSMKPDERDAAVTSFMGNPHIKVMLVSLTAGNAGLNLTAASQVIIIEPFWNPFVEEQAIDRAHRIGQKREVTVHRLHIAGTIEDRILALQEGKKALVNTALCEKGARSVSRLGVQELRRLFNC